MEIDGKRVYALILRPEGLHVEFRDVIPNVGAAVAEQYGVDKCYVPMGNHQWWRVGYKGNIKTLGWYAVPDQELPKEIQLWLALLE